MRPQSYDFLVKLLETPSPSGFERRVQRIWLDYVKPFADRTWSDAYGNCFASIDPPFSGSTEPAFGSEPTSSSTPTIALCGHADEIGLMVNHFDDKGFIFCRPIGGIDITSIVGKRVVFDSTVPGVQNPVVGVIGATAIHLQEKASDPKIRKLHELFIDIGAKDRDSAAARLNIGDAGVFADGVYKMSDDLIIGRGLDNRIGIWASSEGLRLAAERKSELKARVVAVSTVQEEIGLNGAGMAADSLRPHVALITDVGHATDSPGINQAQHGSYKLAGGPKIAVGAAMHPAVVARLLEVAAKREIPIQRAATPGRSGTDTDNMFTRGGGTPCGLVSLPIRYMHTTVEMTSLLDLDRIAIIFAEFCLSMKKDERFTGSI